MKRNVIETALGAVVIGVAAFFLAFSYKSADVAAGGDGFEVIANFSGIGGLKAGDDVQISGVKVGSVKGVDLDQNTYLARVSLSIDPAIKLPSDTAALISSESLLGGKYLALEPGADENLIPAGGTIQFTQAPQNLEQLLGQFIFSMQDKDKEEEKEEAADAPAPAAPVMQTAPAPEAEAPSEAAEPATP
jgi:phospholipid/cholesterol/gamma-HCH transport system substrate-binding protein